MTSTLLTVISEAKINIKIKKTPKIITAKVIPKVLREVHAETTEVSLKKKVIPKTLSSIALRDTGSTID
jgi:hypothetical protein